MLTTDTSQMQQYQQMLDHGMQQQPQQQQIGSPAEAQIYKTQVQDPNEQLHAQGTPIQGMPRSDIWKNLTFDRSWLQHTQHPAEAQGAQILKPYQPYQESSRMQPQGNPDIYQAGLGSLFNNLGGPRQPQSAFENQFSELQNQMGGFGEQFTGLETSIGGLGESITAITDRLDSIEQGIKGLKTDDTSQAYTRMNWQPFSEWGRRRN
jgi:hypothetical protein